MDWTGGLDWWTGLVDWTGGLTLKLILSFLATCGVVWKPCSLLSVSEALYIVIVKGIHIGLSTPIIMST